LFLLHFLALSGQLFQFWIGVGDEFQVKFRKEENQSEYPAKKMLLLLPP